MWIQESQEIEGDESAYGWVDVISARFIHSPNFSIYKCEKGFSKLFGSRNILHHEWMSIKVKWNSIEVHFPLPAHWFPLNRDSERKSIDISKLSKFPVRHRTGWMWRCSTKKNSSSVWISAISKMSKWMDCECLNLIWDSTRRFLHFLLYAAVIPVIIHHRSFSPISSHLILT